MSTPALLGATLEIALNRLLGLEPSVPGRLARLAGRRLRVELAGFRWRFDLLLTADGRVQVLTDADVAADVEVSGPLPGLIRLALRDAPGPWPDGVEVQGDTDLLDQLRRLLAGIGLDGEELLAAALGGAAAHRVAQGVRSLFGWGRESLRTLSLDAAEYLREETYTLARGGDVAQFSKDVEDLRDALERCAARLDRLEARLETDAQSASLPAERS